MVDAPALLTLSQTAALLGITTKRVRHLADAHRLPRRWVSETRYRFPRAAVEAYAAGEAGQARAPAALRRGNEIAWLRETASLYRQLALRYEKQADDLSEALTQEQT